MVAPQDDGRFGAEADFRSGQTVLARLNATAAWRHDVALSAARPEPQVHVMTVDSSDVNCSFVLV